MKELYYNDVVVVCVHRTKNRIGFLECSKYASDKISSLHFSKIPLLLKSLEYDICP